MIVDEPDKIENSEEHPGYTGDPNLHGRVNGPDLCRSFDEGEWKENCLQSIAEYSTEGKEEPSLSCGWIALDNGRPHEPGIERMDDSRNTQDDVRLGTRWLVSATDKLTIDDAAVLRTFEVRWGYAGLEVDQLWKICCHCKAVLF